MLDYMDMIVEKQITHPHCKLVFIDSHIISLCMVVLWWIA